MTTDRLCLEPNHPSESHRHENGETFKRINFGQPGWDGPPCIWCNAPTRRTGACWTCIMCGATTSC